jgi:hypothetical protein
MLYRNIGAIEFTLCNSIKHISLALASQFDRTNGTSGACQLIVNVYGLHCFKGTMHSSMLYTLSCPQMSKPIQSVTIASRAVKEGIYSNDSHAAIHEFLEILMETQEDFSISYSHSQVLLAYERLLLPDCKR